MTDGTHPNDDYMPEITFFYVLIYGEDTITDDKCCHLMLSFDAVQRYLKVEVLQKIYCTQLHVAIFSLHVLLLKGEQKY